MARQMFIRLLVVNMMLFSFASAASLSAPRHARVGATGELSLLAAKVRGDSEHLVHRRSHTAAHLREASDGNRKLRREVHSHKEDPVEDERAVDASPRRPVIPTSAHHSTVHFQKLKKIAPHTAQPPPKPTAAAAADHNAVLSPDATDTSKVEQGHSLATKDAAAKPPAASADPKTAPSPDATDTSKVEQDQALATKDPAAKPPAAAADPTAALSPDATDTSKVEQDQWLATKDQEKDQEKELEEKLNALEAKAQDAIEAAKEAASFTSFNAIWGEAGKTPCHYINLANRTDRQLRMSGELARAGLNCSRLDAFNKTEFNGSAQEASRQSHIKALDLIDASDSPYGLVLEDDVVWNQNMSVVHQVMSRMDESIKKYPVILLACEGYASQDVSKADEPWMRQVGPWSSQADEQMGCVTSSGYIIRKDYIPKLRNLWVNGSLSRPLGRKVDIMWKDLQKTDGWGLTKPSLLIQGDGFSDIEGRDVPHNERAVLRSDSS